MFTEDEAMALAQSLHDWRCELDHNGRVKEIPRINMRPAYTAMCMRHAEYLRDVVDKLPKIYNDGAAHHARILQGLPDADES